MTFRNCRRGLAAMAAAAVVLTGGGLASAQSGGPQEGIKVHGRWAIEVRNPDGTVAQRVEFSNALDVGGPQILATLLGRAGVPGRWQLSLAAPQGGVSPCEGGTGGRHPNWCKLIEAAATNSTGGNAESRNLVVTTAVLAGPGSNVSMTGSIVALTAGSIGRVSTSIGACGDPTTISGCNTAGGANIFSTAWLGTPGHPAIITGIVPGQIIQVTVTFTFS